jgi:hypothetical protein
LPELDCDSDSGGRARKTVQAGLILQGWLPQAIFLQFPTFFRLRSVSHTV